MIGKIALLPKNNSRPTTLGRARIPVDTAQATTMELMMKLSSLGLAMALASQAALAANTAPPL